MSSHVYHPDTLQHGLSDDCPECKHKAANPTGLLDAPHVRDLWSRMVAVEHRSSRPGLDLDYQDVAAYRTEAEATACRHLYVIAVFLERHANIDPWCPLEDLA